ncbi:S-adenosyl-L-methionine-dependent methyltransferases superfamily protein [Artemisia annua]|uniref:S-adenosyl-L-methionine-dependent methyltransferases superfamily protein n=1 Tax=Artemisia annua TaxID=35608 RepID=A0A2U1KN34_ARTAN|nr:S-adenosyl-L-methionine-dependent methyltransferases superfamily protein [Artemisia annua]
MRTVSSYHLLLGIDLGLRIVYLTCCEFQHGSTHIPAQPVSASSQHNNRHQHIRMSNTRSKRVNSHSPYGYRTATACLKNGPTSKKYPHDPGYGNANGSVDVSGCGGNDTKTNGQVVDAGFVEQALLAKSRSHYMLTL